MVVGKMLKRPDISTAPFTPESDGWKKRRSFFIETRQRSILSESPARRVDRLASYVTRVPNQEYYSAGT